MKKCILCIDCQYDFMEEGKLAVNGATEKMNNLAEHIKNNDYDLKVFTCDWHPYNHNSFIRNEGKWPEHCVAHTHGASIFEPLFMVANGMKGDCKVLTKGLNPSTEEYSIFDNAESYKWLTETIDLNAFDKIYVGGIVGTICVKNSIIGLMKIVPKEKVVVLTSCVANFDDGTEFKNWLKEENIAYV